MEFVAGGFLPCAALEHGGRNVIKLMIDSLFLYKQCGAHQRFHSSVPGGAEMANPDLRDWLAQMEAAGELQKVSGADRKEEIGGIVDIYQRQTNRPALLFDDIPGYPRGYRVAANILTGVKRIALTLGMPAESSEIDLVNYWRRYLTEARSIPPAPVKSGPVLDNVYSGKEVDLARIPVP